ncbi:MAG: hypothetical protein J5608_02350 [Alphaproteobacteria bacterium]|nr:hypothetical protein [Alphaproteobacteria bacterium]
MKKVLKPILLCTLASMYISNSFGLVITKDDNGKVYVDGEHILRQGSAPIAEGFNKIKKLIAKTTTEEKHADCKQAFDTALKHSTKIQKKLNNVPMLCTSDHISFYDSKDTSYWRIGTMGDSAMITFDREGNRYFVADNKLNDSSILHISGFVDGGLFKRGGLFMNNNTIFIYTKNRDYATGDLYKSDYIFKYVGNYKYETPYGERRSIPAYQETKYKVAEILPYNYKKDKTLDCAYDEKNKQIYWDGDEYYHKNYRSDGWF